jgi:hypothetical protein
MARMFPSSLTEKARQERTRSAGVLLFDRFEASLPKSFRVFYSVRWLARSQEGGARDGEADFVIVHPDNGFLFIEVKGGRISISPDCRWQSTYRDGESFEIADPVDQARKTRSALLGKLKSLPGWKQWIRAGSIESARGGQHSLEIARPWV